MRSAWVKSSAGRPRGWGNKIRQMTKWRQYELWVQVDENKWEMVGVFPTPDLPTAMANARSTRSRLIEVVYEGTKLLGQEVIAELGANRREP